jgi:hypothetical protein
VATELPDRQHKSTLTNRNWNETHHHTRRIWRH